MTQAIGKVNINVNDVDLATISSHKIYGPKGIGLLYKTRGLVLTPLLYGHDDSLVPGTPALPLIVSFAKALRLALKDITKKEETVKKHYDKIVEHLSNNYPNVIINSSKYCIPHILNISLMDIKPETFIHALEKDEVYVSSNTACSKGKKSESVYQMTHDDKRSETTIRISISPYTLPSEITEFLESFDKHYNELIKLV